MKRIAIRRSLQLIGAPMSSDKHEPPSLLFLLLLPREYSCGQVHTIITVKVVRRGTISAGTRSFRFGATATTHKFTAFFSGDRTGVMSIHHAARWDYVTTLLSSLSYSAVMPARIIHSHPLGFARGAASC